MRVAVIQWRNGSGNGVVVRYLKCRISQMFFQTGCGEHEKNKKLGMMSKFLASEIRCGTLTDKGYSQKRNRHLECEI